MSFHVFVIAVFGLFGFLGRGFGQAAGPDEGDQSDPSANYVAEDGVTNYVAEDGVTNYVTEA